MFRWTIKELETMSDLEIIKGVLVERQSTCTNVYSPLYKKLQRLYNQISNLLQKKETEINCLELQKEHKCLKCTKEELLFLQDKLSRRNMQIKELKVYKIAWENWFSIINAGVITVSECIEIAHKVLPDDFNR